jgi:fructose-1,6-bisphosphatase I
MVADFHRILLKGGVFMYPPTQKSPEGKLRLMYEAKPLAMVAEQAGGLCTDGATRMLEKRPEALHERTPVIIGSRRNVEDVHKFIDGREHLALGPAEPKAEKALAQKAAEPSSESAPA